MRSLRLPIVAALAALAALAQYGGRVPERDLEDAPLPAREAEFHFIRLEYTDLPQFHRGWGRVVARAAGRAAGGLWIGRLPITTSPSAWSA